MQNTTNIFRKKKEMFQSVKKSGYSFMMLQFNTFMLGTINMKIPLNYILHVENAN